VREFWKGGTHCIAPPHPTPDSLQGSGFFYAHPDQAPITKTYLSIRLVEEVNPMATTYIW